MAVETVHMDRALPLPDPRQIVGKGRARIDPDFQNFRFPECRVKRIRRREQLEKRSCRHPVALGGLDHRGAKHVDAIAVRHHVQGKPGMQQAGSDATESDRDNAASAFPP